MQRNLNKFKNIPSLARNDDDDEDQGNIRNQHLPYFESTRTDRCIKIFLDEYIREPK